MRVKDSHEQTMYLETAIDRGQCENLLAGLDALGEIPWQINRPIFEVVQKVWNSGERFADIPPAAYDGVEPSKPESYETDQVARAVYYKQMQMWSNKKTANHSDRCSINYKVEIARSVRRC